MEKFSFVSFKYQWRNKISNIIMMIILALSLVSVIVTYEATESLRYSYEQKSESIYGAQTGIIFDVDQEIKVLDSVEKYGIFLVIGSSKYVNGTSVNQKVVLGSADSNAIDLHHLTLREGNWPQNKNEIVVEQWVIDELKLEQWNTTLQFNENKYTISGVINNYASIQNIDNRNKSDEQSLPNILVKYESNMEGTKHVSVLLKNHSEEAFNEFCNHNFDGKQNKQNDMLKASNEDSGPDEVQTVILMSFCIITALICFVAILIFVYFSMSDESEFLRITYTIGISLKRLIQHLLIKFGVMILGIFILSYILRPMFVYWFDKLLFRVFSIQLIWTNVQYSEWFIYSLFFMIFMLLVIIICTIQYRKVTNRPNRLKRRKKAKHVISNNIGYIMFYRGLTQNYIKSFVTIMSIVVFTVLICISPCIKGVANNERQKTYCDFEIQDNLEMYAGPLKAISQQDFGFNYDSIKDIVLDPLVHNSYLLKGIRVNVFEPANLSSDLIENVLGTKIQPFTDEESDIKEYTESLEAYNYRLDDNLYGSSLLEIRESDLNKLEKYTLIGEINKDKLCSGQEAIMICQEKLYDTRLDKVLGIEFLMTQIVDVDYETGIGRRVDFPVKITGILVIPDTDVLEVQAFKANRNGFVWCEGAFEKLGIRVNYNRCYLELEDPSYIGNLNEKISSLILKYPNVSYVSRYELSIQQKSLSNLVKLFTEFMSISVIILIITINIVQYIIRLRDQKNLFLSLYHIGVSPNCINKILLYEFMGEIVLALCISVPFICLFAYGFINEITNSSVGREFLKVLYSVGIYIIAYIMIGIGVFMYNKRYLMGIIKDTRN